MVQGACSALALETATVATSNGKLMMTRQEIAKEYLRCSTNP